MPRWTIARSAETAGAALHTGRPVRLRLSPGAPRTGIVFRRADLPDGPVLPALVERVVATERRTGLGSEQARVETVEHLLAAAYALGLDDLQVELDGPEVPILDGSFAPFVELLDGAGRTPSRGGRNRLGLTAPLELREGQSHYRVEPGRGLRVRVTLEYAEPVIGHQCFGFRVGAETFRREVAPARTYGFLAEVEALRDRGLLGGAAPDAALVLSPVAVVNGALRWPDEFARHKAGDLVGDLALLGARLDLRVTAERPSHRGNLACARAIARAARLTEA